MANKDREIDTTLFSFNKEISLTLFVPKKNKAVILVSTFHHTKEIDSESNKPKIICDLKLKSSLTSTLFNNKFSI